MLDASRKRPLSVASEPRGNALVLAIPRKRTIAALMCIVQREESSLLVLVQGL